MNAQMGVSIAACTSWLVHHLQLLVHAINNQTSSVSAVAVQRSRATGFGAMVCLRQTLIIRQCQDSGGYALFALSVHT